MLVVALAGLLLGCNKGPTTVAGACDGDFEGSDAGVDGGKEGIGRMNCYRRLAGLGDATIDPQVQEAVDNHVHYLQDHLVTQDATAEDPEESDFTGEDDWSRLDAVGYTAPTTVAMWPLPWKDYDSDLDGEFITPEDLVDAWVLDPYYRQTVLQPAWVAGGFAQDEGYTYANVLFAVPPVEHVAHAIPYPVDGQTDVPTTWVSTYSGYPDDGVTDGDDNPHGFPITITVGTEAIDPTSTNPIGLSVEEATLTKADGSDVALDVVTPDNAATTLWFTVILVPESPLDADTDYTLDARVGAFDGVRRVKETFHTQAEP